MPLRKREKPDEPTPPQTEPLDALLADLRHADPERRWSAARRMGELAGTAAPLVAALAGEKEPRVIEAIFTSLIRRGGAESAAYLLPLLRSDEADLRGGAIEALQTMPAELARHIGELLHDPDSDVRIFAVEMTRKMPPAQAAPWLCEILDRDPHANVCATAVDVLADIGSPDAIPHLERCRDRFPAQPFLPFAVAVVIETLSGSAK
jgi:HEAT repeat protein